MVDCYLLEAFLRGAGLTEPRELTESGDTRVHARHFWELRPRPVHLSKPVIQFLICFDLRSNGGAGYEPTRRTNLQRTWCELGPVDFPGTNAVPRKARISGK